MKKVVWLVLLVILMSSLTFADDVKLTDRLAPQETLWQYFKETRLSYGFGCIMTYGDGDGDEVVGSRSAEDVNMQNVEPLFVKDLELVRGIIENRDCSKQEFEYMELYRSGDEYIFIVSEQRDNSVIALYDFVDEATGEVVARAYNPPNGVYHRLAKDYICNLNNRNIVVKKPMTIAEKVSQRQKEVNPAKGNVYSYYSDIGPIPVNINGSQGQELIDHIVDAGGGFNATSKIEYTSSTNNMNGINIGLAAKLE